ncbi:IS30 family transposase [Aeromicrobium sp.]|uniref:IS30 family transposase n=1 Tax=Aeromicrobium sp. TaxID=1871063 RepID=UPI0025C2E083|nr:IS30 family transposase [Aeromicrobium sp.]
MQGRYLSLFERERIQTLTAQDVGVREIARRLGRSPSTISRELNRPTLPDTRGRSRGDGGGGGGYDAGAAHQHATELARRQRRSKLAADVWLHDFVQAKLELEWSPEQISGYLSVHHTDHTVSPETIYLGLYLPHRGALRRDLAKKLRTGRTLRQPHRRKDARTTRYIDPGRLIDERPEEVEDRVVAGHWEGDLITGAYNVTAIGTLVERTSGLVQLVHLPVDHTAKNVCPAVAATMASQPSPRTVVIVACSAISAPWSQVSERRIEGGVFFALPGSPWQRGSNENTNGLLRQYFPKSSNLDIHSAVDLHAVAERLNGRPRKRHGWKTPAEIYASHVQDSELTVATTD